MNNFSRIRRIIQVFQHYGISLSGERKFDNLYHDLKMEPVFVMGLIFELELVAQVYLNDEDVYSVQEPIQIIDKLLDLLQVAGEKNISPDPALRGELIGEKVRFIDSTSL